MLFVERSRVALAGSTRKLLQKEAERAARFFRLSDRGQQRFEFSQEVIDETWSELNELFWGTCAFCESEVEPLDLNVTRFRPKTEACNLDNSTDSEHYWWLAYEWENLYLTCTTCDRNKQNFFPVEGPRLPIGVRGPGIAEERNLLIDPCRDQPSQYLLFSEDGNVGGIPWNPISGSDRGAVTVQTFGLNRPELVAARRDAIAKIGSLFDSIIALEESNQLSTSSKQATQYLKRVIDALDERGAFIAAKRQAVAARLAVWTSLRNRLKKIAPGLLKELSDIVSVELDVRARLDKLTKASETGFAEVVESTAAPAPTYENAYVRSIEIRNFRALRNLKLGFNDMSEFSGDIGQLDRQISALTTGGKLLPSTSLVTHKVGWKLLVGENGTGKSTILKALSLALMGADYWTENAEILGLDPSRFFNNATKENTGFIKVELSKGEPIEIRFNRNEAEFVSGANGGANMYFRAYGAMRVFSGSGNSYSTPAEPLAKDPSNLFRPASKLTNPDKFLLSVSEQAFDSAALALRDLLEIPRSIRRPLRRDTSGVMLNTGNGYLPFGEQSDGYSSVIALVVDILSGLPESIRDQREASGIVILDEIDAHLHPRWKMRIVECLRRTFPKIQFICTTHEPLCLRGLAAREIAVLSRGRGRVELDDNVPSTTGMRVDQLLTSPIFGLESTIDPETEIKYHLYYKLKGFDPPSDPELLAGRDDLLRRLESELNGVGTLGNSRRQRLFYEELQKSGPEPEVEIVPTTRKLISDLWESVAPKEGPQ